MRKVYLDDLPIWGKEGHGNEGSINWRESIGYNIEGIYDGVNFEIKIVDYDGRYLYIKYLDEPVFKTFTRSFKECELGNILGKKTSDFKIEIGQIFKDDKRDITIIDREYRTRYKKDGSKCSDKWYKYRCNKCGWTEGWIIEGDLIGKGNGCGCCGNRTTVEGINDIPTTAPWMIPYFQGGYYEAKLYTCNSHKKIQPTCPDCGRVKDKCMNIKNIFKRHSIGCICSDGISYPEKLVYFILEQLGIDFKTQLNKTTFKWCGKYKYDFYFEYNGEDYIIETHGGQHYKESSRGRTLEEEQANDKYKKELAIKNGIKEENYIIIDCRYSESWYIKQNIMSSRLNEILDLSIIDWNKCEEFALSNRVKEACDLWNSGIKSTKEIGMIMKLNKNTIIRYLKRGAKLGWCDYNEHRQVGIFKDDKSFGIFPSCAELERQSEELFGVKLLQQNISLVATGKRKTHKGFTFQYI